MIGTRILEKGLKLFEELAQSAEGKTAAELANLIEVHKSNVYRYLNTLLDSGYIKSDGNGRYHLSSKVLELGSQMLRRMPVREVARPFLIELSSNAHKTVHLCVLDGYEVVYIDKVESYKTLPMISRIGSRAPAYCTAVGKVLLSHLLKDQLISLLHGYPLKKQTDRTITDPLQLLQELKITAERGYAIDDEENEQGVMCVAAPVREQAENVIVAISATGLKRDFEGERFDKIVEAVVTTANKVSKRLGYAMPEHEKQYNKCYSAYEETIV